MRTTLITTAMLALTCCTAGQALTGFGAGLKCAAPLATAGVPDATDALEALGCWFESLGSSMETAQLNGQDLDAAIVMAKAAVLDAHASGLAADIDRANAKIAVCDRIAHPE